MVTNDKKEPGKKSEPKAKRGGNGRGVDLMNEAMDVRLANGFNKVNNAIWQKAIKGDLPAVRMVISLAMKSGESKAEANQRMESVAARLAAEPPWVSESSEESAETAGGSREPEN